MLVSTLKGRYRIIRHLGSGGFGQTFVAEDTHLPTAPLCVVKQLSPPTCEPYQLELAKRLFDKEAETLYRLGKHERIPQLLAHFEEQKEFYLVQEYIEGHNLAVEINDRQCLPPEAVLPILQDVLEVLVFVHQNQVIHRDIKPHNLIRRQSDQRIVLIDFGAVKQVSGLASDATGNTYTSITIGTPGYMPNEQLGGKPRFSSDLYALGMVCIQALTATHPELIPEDPHTAELAWHDLLSLPYRQHPIVRILDKMVRLDFRQRFQSAQEVLNAIARVSNDATAPPTSPTPRPQTKIDTKTSDSKTNPLIWVGLIGSFVFLPIGLAIATFNYLRTASPTPTTPTTTAKATFTPPPITVTAVPQPMPTPNTPNTPELPPPVRDNAYLLQAHTLMRQGRQTEALALIEQGLQAQPRNPHIWLFKAVTLKNMGRIGEAKQACQQANLTATEDRLKRRVMLECQSF